MNKALTKIVCTIGPASGDKDTLLKLFEAGMSVARLNFSHGTKEQHLEFIKNIREVEKTTAGFIGILGDLQGPKIRIGELKEKEYQLKAGDTLKITTKPIIGDGKTVSTTYRHLVKDVSEGDLILIDDGNLRLKVIEKDNDTITCKVLNSAVLKPHKGINIPGVELSTPSITEKDIEFIEFAKENNLDFLAVSFVRKPEDILIVKQHLKGAPIKVIAKIERPEALECIEEIIDVADGVMVARGDLGIEIPLERVPFEQKRIISIANRKNKYVITATQMLESMIEHPTPTRAEVTDIANAILDGTDAIMLSGETSTGKYPVLAVETMQRIAKAAEKHLKPLDLTDIMQERLKEKSDFAISFSAAAISHLLDVKYIVAFTKSGHTSLLISKQKPATRIITFTTDNHVARQCMAYRGVIPVLCEEIKSIDNIFEFLNPYLKNTGFAECGDRIVLTMGIPFGKPGTTNLLHVMTVE